MGKKHVNIPIFIPHLGCPNNCVFCNQHTISGHGEFELLRAEREIDDALLTISEDTPTEIAFFGGSFTGIDRELMVSLLELAESYVRKGRVECIRLSTRPDYIDGEILSILSRYSVRTVELGLQSLEDDVLCASKRGHSVECAERACREIKAAGFELIGQMMIGLPHSTLQAEIRTAERICALGADGARVYPTVVFADTELADMTARGEYVPLELEDAVRRTAKVLDVFERAGVPCIRVGLCASENLSDASKAVAGANHAAIGELAMNELYLYRICDELDRLGARGGNLTVFVSRGSVSKAVGQKRRNIVEICKKYELEWAKVLEKNEIIGYNIIIEYTKQTGDKIHSKEKTSVS